MVTNWVSILGTDQVIGPSLLLSCSWELELNEDGDLYPGTVAVGQLQFSFIADGVDIQQGTVVQYWQRQDGEETGTLIATCICDKPVYTGVMRGDETHKVYEAVAYDKASLTEKDLSEWLMEHQSSFPMTMQAFANAVAEQCGLDLAGTLPRNGDYQIPAFYADGLTGRQLLSWVGQATCTYCHALSGGQLAFDWYYLADGSVSVGASDEDTMLEVRLAGDVLRVQPQPAIYRITGQQIGYYEGTLSYEDYECAPIDKVQIRQSDTDVGVVYPAAATGTNALVIQGNLLLSASGAEQLQPVAEAIYSAMFNLGQNAYTPCQFEIPVGSGVRAGSIISVTDALGKQFWSFLMTEEFSSGRANYTSTGNPTRDSSTAVNQQTYRNQQGRRFELEVSIDGLRATAIDLQGKQAELTLTVDGLASTVEANYDALKQYADDAANQARDEAIQSAVDQAEAAFGQELQLYPTKVEMDSAIRQSAGEISSQVNMTLEGYATKEYTDTAAQDAKDFASSAAQDALDQANADTDSKLALYPTTVEMNSAITQTASQITSQVSQTLTQYSTTSESQAYADGVAGDAETAAKQYADQAAGQAEGAANAATDNKLKNYSTTVQMNSAIDQKANQITLSVNQTLTRYSTTEESEQYADQAAQGAEDAANAATDGKLQNYSTTTQMQAAIGLAVDKISLSVSNGSTSSTLTLKAGETILSSEQITFSGLVSFTDLSSAGGTVINGSNITTGTLDASKVNVTNLNASNITAGILTGRTISGGTITGTTITGGYINGSVFTSTASGGEFIQINNGNFYIFGTSRTARLAIRPNGDNSGTIDFWTTNGFWCGSISAYRDGDLGRIQATMGSNGFFGADRIQTGEIAVNNDNLFSDGYKSLNGNYLMRYENGIRQCWLDRLALNGGVMYSLQWVNINGHYALCRV